MLSNLVKKFMPKKQTEDKGVSAEDMKLPELKVLAVSLQLFTEEEVKTMKKPALLEAIHAKEDEMVNDVNRKGLKRAPVADEYEEEAQPIDPVDTLGTHEGKKVIRKTNIELNGKQYVDILVETGETYRELAD